MATGSRRKAPAIDELEVSNFVEDERMDSAAKPSNLGAELCTVGCSKKSGSATGIQLKQHGWGNVTVHTIDESSPLFGQLQPGDRIRNITGTASGGKTLQSPTRGKPNVESYGKILMSSAELSIEVERSAAANVLAAD